MSGDSLSDTLTDTQHRELDGFAEREYRLWCVSAARQEWENLHVGEILHNHLGEIIRVADALYQYIVTGKLETDRYRPRD